mmetsp:Transcript_26621/g.40410  ORF Transcript_26621/g.40410 Transcript_26621/m.40410 type:complete len:90 (+) Transcript_26621:1013-1282(+)
MNHGIGRFFQLSRIGKSHTFQHDTSALLHVVQTFATTVDDRRLTNADSEREVFRKPLLHGRDGSALPGSGAVVVVPDAFDVSRLGNETG